MRSHRPGSIRAPRDHINMSMLQSTVSGIPLIVDLCTRMSDPFSFMWFAGPLTMASSKVLAEDSSCFGVLQ